MEFLGSLIHARSFYKHLRMAACVPISKVLTKFAVRSVCYYLEKTNLRRLTLARVAPPVML